MSEFDRRLSDNAMGALELLSSKEMHATLRSDLGAILGWAGSGAGKEKTDTPASRLSVSVVAGVGFEPTTFRL